MRIIFILLFASCYSVILRDPQSFKHDRRNKLGEGGQGSVHVATHESTFESVAVKEQIVDEEYNLEAAVNEIVYMLHFTKESVAYLKHIDFISFNPIKITFGMKRSVGSLDYFLKSSTVSSVNMEEMAIGLFKAVVELLKRNLILEDLHSRNVLVDVGNQIVISDFGFVYEMTPFYDVKMIRDVDKNSFSSVKRNVLKLAGILLNMFTGKEYPFFFFDFFEPLLAIKPMMDNAEFWPFLRENSVVSWKTIILDMMFVEDEKIVNPVWIYENMIKDIIN